MSATEQKRVFILGAGFSKPANMPVANELTSLLLEADLIGDDQDFQDWVGDLRKRIGHLNQFEGGGGNKSVTVEQLFEYADFDRELWLMRQQACPTVHGSHTPLARARSISFWLYFLQYSLAGVLIEKQIGADSSLLPTLGNHLRKGDTVLTFNYDTMLEGALSTCGRSWWHGFATEKSGDVTVLKLHGSIDWWLAPRERLTGRTLVLVDTQNRAIDYSALENLENLAWEDRFVLTRVDSLEKAKEYNEEHTGQSWGKAPWPGLGGLGAHKPLHRLIGSGLVWMNALASLKEADEILTSKWY